MKNNELAVLLVAIGTLDAPATEPPHPVQADPNDEFAVLDADVPGPAGLSDVAALLSRCLETRLVVVSGRCDTKTIQAALQQGEDASTPERTNTQILLNALRAILSGGIGERQEAVIAASPPRKNEVPAPSLPPASALALPAASAEARARAAALGLTNRQIDVLSELLCGTSNKQICRNLQLAMGTVKAHVAAVLAALAVNSRAEAIAEAHRLGLRELVGQRDSGAPSRRCPENTPQ